MHHYDLGAQFSASVNGRDFVIMVDDITNLPEVFARPNGALFWVNPPLSTGSLKKFQRRAAKTTEGVRQVGLKQIYESIAEMMDTGSGDDGFVWMMPEIDGIDKLLKHLGLDDVPFSPGVYHGKPIRVLADNVPVKPMVHVNWSDNGLENFRQLFGDKPDLSEFQCIIDPCAGYSPLHSVAIEHCLGYYGIEINGFEAFRSLRRIRPHASNINEPVVRSSPASGKVIGADDGPTHKPVSELRDFKEGRTFTEIHQRIADRQED